MKENNRRSYFIFNFVFHIYKYVQILLRIANRTLIEEIHREILL